MRKTVGKNKNGWQTEETDVEVWLNTTAINFPQNLDLDQS